MICAYHHFAITCAPSCAGAPAPCRHLHPRNAAGGAPGSCGAGRARRPCREAGARAVVALPRRDQAPPQRALGGALLGRAAGAPGLPGCGPISCLAYMHVRMSLPMSVGCTYFARPPQRLLDSPSLGWQLGGRCTWLRARLVQLPPYSAPCLAHAPAHAHCHTNANVAGHRFSILCERRQSISGIFKDIGQGLRWLSHGMQHLLQVSPALSLQECK